MRPKRQMTVPFRPFAEAELEVGDRIRFRADGAGRVIMERIGPPADTLAADDLPGLKPIDRH